MTELGDGLMNLRTSVLQTEKTLVFLRRGSDLFQLMIVDGKKEFLKMLWSVLRRGTFSAFLVEYNVCVTGINMRKFIT